MSVQFKSLRCMDLTSYGINERFLRVDSSIDCDSAAHDDFRKWIIPLIVIYQLIPVMYYALLLQIKDRIKDTPGKHVGMVTAKSDLELMPLRFLYRGYGTNFWFFELVDTYRRILFIGVAPLFETSAHRALAGTTLSFMSVVVYRELQPYKNPSTNMLSMATNYQVAFTYSCALLLDGGLLDEYVGNDLVGHRRRIRPITRHDPPPPPPPPLPYPPFNHKVPERKFHAAWHDPAARELARVATLHPPRLEESL